MQLTLLIVGILLIAAIIFVIYVISNANRNGYELYVFRHGGYDEYYDFIMFNNKNKEWQVSLYEEQYIKVSSVFNISKFPETYPFAKYESYAYLKCDKTTAYKIRFFIDNII
jgi:hypothetical protein